MVGLDGRRYSSVGRARAANVRIAQCPRANTTTTAAQCHHRRLHPARTVTLPTRWLQEFDHYKPWEMACFSCGCALCGFGLYVLSTSREPGDTTLRHVVLEYVTTPRRPFPRQPSVKVFRPTLSNDCPACLLASSAGVKPFYRSGELLVQAEEHERSSRRNSGRLSCNSCNSERHSERLSEVEEEGGLVWGARGRSCSGLSGGGSERGRSSSGLSDA